MAPTPILERDTHVASLSRYAQEAAEGAGRLVLVSGEAGVGKSTLLDQLAAGLPGRTWWWGACDGMSTPRPLGPFFDIAADAGGRLGALCAEGAPRDALFGALVEAIDAEDGPTVVVVEDVHWADEASLDLLRFLGRRVRGIRVLVLVTYRDDSLVPTHPLRLALGDLTTQRSTRRITLGPLSRRAVAVLAEGTDHEPDELHRLTGGSPFFLNELLESRVPGVPSSARDAVLARAAGLDEEARRALDCAALIGLRFEPELLLAATGVPRTTLDALVGSSLLVADGRLLRFRHEIARQAVAGEVAPHHATELHTAILGALLAAGDDDAAQLSFHAEGAGDDALVLRHAPRAAREAADLAAHRESAAQFERAIRHAGAADVRTRAELADALAEELACVERWEEASDARTLAIGLWCQLGDRLREGDSHARRGKVMWRLCCGSEAAAEFRRARELLEPFGTTPELARLLVTGADGIDLDEIDRHIRLGHEMATALDRPDLLVHALNGEGFVAASRLEDFETPLREALDLAVRHGLQLQIGLSYANLTEYLVADLRFAEAQRYVDEAMPYCDEHDVAVYGNCVRGHYALALLDTGRWEECAAVTRQVLAIPASPINRLTSLTALGLMCARRGQPEATDLLAEAQAAGDGVDEAQWVCLAGIANAEASWLAGDLDAARAHVSRVRRRLTDADLREASVVTAWEHRLGVPTNAVPVVPPYSVQVSGTPRQAAEAWDALSMPYHAALALGDSVDDGDLREAVERLDLLGADAVARLVRQQMRKLGMRAIPAGVRATTRADPLGLTPREREVLDLVSEGLTNDEIADRLVISSKTAGHHVSNVLTKLGVSSRRQAASFAREAATT